MLESYFYIPYGLLWILLYIMPLITYFCFQNISILNKIQDHTVTNKRALSFGMGLLLGDIFLHFMPILWRISKEQNNQSLLISGLWIIGGIIIFFVWQKSHNKMNILQSKNADDFRSIADENNSNDYYKECICDKDLGYLTLIASCLENLCHGLLLGASFVLPGKIGLFTTIIILCHEIPYEFRDFVLLLQSGFHIHYVVLCEYFSSLWKIIGAAICLILGEKLTLWVELWLIPIASGALLYIALVIICSFMVIERSSNESCLQLFFICMGISVSFFVSLCTNSISTLQDIY